MTGDDKESHQALQHVERLDRLWTLGLASRYIGFGHEIMTKFKTTSYRLGAIDEWLHEVSTTRSPKDTDT